MRLRLPDFGRSGRAPARRVLVVDDEPMMVRLIGVNLERAGFEVSSAGDGREALEWLGREPCVDLVVVDVMMPVMDGFAFMKALRAEPEFANVPAIVMGSMSNEVPYEETLEKMRRSFDDWFGRCSYIVKPFNPGELVRLVESMLAGSVEG